MGGLLLGGRERLTRAAHRRKAVELINEAHAAGAGLVSARHTQEPSQVPRLRATGPSQVWSWDIFCLPTNVRGIWLYLYLMIDVWIQPLQRIW